jgi:hypothetical protein
MAEGRRFKFMFRFRFKYTLARWWGAIAAAF